MPPSPPRRDAELLSAAIKAVRRHRGLTAAEVAVAMHIGLRSYERLEAGHSRFNFDHLYRFAAATDCDPDGLFLAVAIGSPEFAVRCADNKLATVLMVALQAFDGAMGDRINALETRALIHAFEQTFADLEGDSRRNEEKASDWMARGLGSLQARRPRPGR